MPEEPEAPGIATRKLRAGVRWRTLVGEQLQSLQRLRRQGSGETNLSANS